jgi:hypothetical protein
MNAKNHDRPAKAAGNPSAVPPEITADNGDSGVMVIHRRQSQAVIFKNLNATPPTLPIAFVCEPDSAPVESKDS